MKDAVAYKVLTASQMAALEADGSLAGAPVDLADGYIHLSTATQLTETVDKHFAGQTDLHVAAVDLEALGEAVRWEQARGGALFPHLYAALPLDAVVAYAPLDRDAKNRVTLPVTGGRNQSGGMRVGPGMTHTPPVPAGNQSPYPLQTPPHVHTPDAPAPGDPRIAKTPAPAPAPTAQHYGAIALAAGLGLAALAGGLFVALRERPKPKPKAKPKKRKPRKTAQA
jgi:uncharacterized protein (DUF952 family)